MKWVTLCGLALLLAAGAANAPAFAAPTGIVVIGDSNIAGKGVSSSEAYPAKLERALRAKGYDVRVTNAGVNGAKVPDVLFRVILRGAVGNEARHCVGRHQ